MEKDNLNHAWVIRENTTLEPRVYDLPGGILIDADGVTLDGNGALLVGAHREGAGVTILNHSGVTVRGLRAVEYRHGIRASGCSGLVVEDCRVTSTAELPANTLFLDVWLPAEKSYGGGILLEGCADSRVSGCDLQHQMCGLLAYGCRRLEVRGNNASYCSGYGFHLYETCDSLYEDNCADYCCRWEPRGGRTGHMGADATGFLIIRSSSRNRFRRNLARMGGDGFFMAGLSMEYGSVPCNDNLFEENDGSWSPNIAFEATFCAGNIFRNNYADHCNYGFWLGFSRGNILEGNRIQANVRAGIAVENGVEMVVRDNEFANNEYGILLWSKYIPEFDAYVPENDTSRDWILESNRFTHHNRAVRIAANLDHGVRPYRIPEGETPQTWRRPHGHLLRGNRFSDNRVAIETVSADQTSLEDNVFEGNVEADTILG